MHDLPDREGGAMNVVTKNLHGRSLCEDTDISPLEAADLLDLAEELRAAKAERREKRHLVGANVALIFEKASTRTRSAFEVAAHDQGAHVTYLGPGESQLGQKESVRDTARVLGRMFDGIEFRGFAQSDVADLARFAGVPVWNGLTDAWHPTQLLADLLTVRDHSDKPFAEVAWCYVGDGRNNTANSFLVASAQMGMDVRVGAPAPLQPSPEVRALALDRANRFGGRVTITDDVLEAVDGVDFIYTDVWLSMGEPESSWDERVKLLLPYQVNADLLVSTRNANVKVLHCLPALHNPATALGARLHERFGLDALEVTDDVFESPASIVFDQAENRLHTIKALMVATLGSA
jgi:ornithine carbamoyltransferase